MNNILIVYTNYGILPEGKRYTPNACLYILNTFTITFSNTQCILLEASFQEAKDKPQIHVDTISYTFTYSAIATGDGKIQQTISTIAQIACPHWNYFELIKMADHDLHYHCFSNQIFTVRFAPSLPSLSRFIFFHSSFSFITSSGSLNLNQALIKMSLVSRVCIQLALIISKTQSIRQHVPYWNYFELIKIFFYQVMLIVRLCYLLHIFLPHFFPENDCNSNTHVISMKQHMKVRLAKFPELIFMTEKVDPSL